MKRYEEAYAGYIYEPDKVCWTSDEQVKNRMTFVDFSDSQSITAGGLPIISDGKTAYVDTGDSHTAIVASSGQKKSVCGFIPIIHTLIKAGESMLLTDPKGELYAKTSGEARKEGYRVICLDFRKMDKDGYNILRFAAQLYREGEKDKATALLSDIISVLAEPQMGRHNDVFWALTAGMFCGGTGTTMFRSFPDLDSINLSNWAKFNTEEAVQNLKQLTDGVESEDTALINLKNVLSEPERTLMSTLSTASSFFAPFIQNDKLARMLSHNTVDLDDLRDKKVAFYIVTDDTTTTYNAVVGIIISQIQTYLVSEAYKMKNGRLQRRFNFVLDEFTSFTIPNMENALATHRGRNIRYYLCIQSIAGLHRRYPHYEAILSNCGNLLFMGSTERALLDRVVDQCGTTHITADGRERPLISGPELMSLEQTWDYKECVYLNLSDSLRCVTKLPSFEAYGIGDVPAYEFTNNFPRVKAYSPAQLLRDIYLEKTKRPFVNSDETEPEEEDNTQDFGGYGYDCGALFKESLEKRFEELFGTVDTDDFDEDYDEDYDEDSDD